MPTLLFVFLVKLAFEAIRVNSRRARRAKPEPLCAECFYAHVQYGANARRAISCTYGGYVRPVTLDVLYCTDYRGRNIPSRSGSIGFVREIASAE